MHYLHRTISHARKRIKHPENRSIIILVLLTLSIPILAYFLAVTPTTINQYAAGTPCEASGGACVANNICNLNCGKCVNNLGCAANTVCCDPGKVPPPPNNPLPPPAQPPGGGNPPPTLASPQRGCFAGANPHTECVGNACVQVFSCGNSQCSSNAQCVNKANGTGSGNGNVCSTGECAAGAGCTIPGQYCEELNCCSGSVRKVNVYVCATVQPSWHWEFAYTQDGGSCFNGMCPGGPTACKAPPQPAIPQPVKTVTPPPVKCTCTSEGKGYPNNKYTCTDSSKNGQCGYYSLCDNAVGGTRPCRDPQPPLCVCTNPGVGVKVGLFGINFIDISGLNGYSCGDDPNKVRFCGLAKDGSPDICGLNENNMGLGISQLPTAPCNSNGTPSTSTASPVAVFATLADSVVPKSAIAVTLNLVKPLGQANETFASTTVLSAQTIKLTDTLTYDRNTSRYVNTDFHFASVPKGDYLIFAKVDGYLAAQLKDQSGNSTITIAPDKVFLPKEITFIPGDVAPDPHGDNFVDINDYNVIISCLHLPVTGSCKNADLNGDGVIDDKDYQILINHFETFGDSYTEPNFTCVMDPSCQSGQGSLQLCSLKCTKNIDF